MLKIKARLKNNTTIVVHPLSNWVGVGTDDLEFTSTDVDNFNNRRLTKDKPNDYIEAVNNIQNSGNLRFYPHRLAHLNEIKTAAYYGADWDSIGWILSLIHI